MVREQRQRRFGLSKLRDGILPLADKLPPGGCAGEIVSARGFPLFSFREVVPNDSSIHGIPRVDHSTFRQFRSRLIGAIFCGQPIIVTARDRMLVLEPPQSEDPREIWHVIGTVRARLASNDREIPLPSKEGRVADVQLPATADSNSAMQERRFANVHECIGALRQQIVTLRESLEASQQARRTIRRRRDLSTRQTVDARPPEPDAEQGQR